MRFSKFTLCSLIILIVVAMVPHSALAAMKTVRTSHGNPVGMDNFEIEIGGDVPPSDARLPASLGWDWTSTYDPVRDITTIVYWGETLVVQDEYVTFGIEMDDVFTPVVKSIYWSQGEEKFLVATTSDSTTYHLGTETADVTIKNPDSTNHLEVLMASWKTVSSYIPLNELDIDNHPPETFTPAGVFPAVLLPGETLSYSFPIVSDEYAVLYVASQFYAPGSRNDRSGVAIVYTELNTDEMATPASLESWTKLKASYE